MGLYEYLTEEHKYTIATIPADWGILSGNSSLLGKMGYHAYIKLPGQRICEWAPTPTAWDRVESGVEVRTATGATIEKMWQAHLEMAPRYHQTGLFTSEGYSKYIPFVNDCFTYVDKILIDNNQKPTKLSRLYDGKCVSNNINNTESKSLANKEESTKTSQIMQTASWFGSGLKYGYQSIGSITNTVISAASPYMPNKNSLFSKKTLLNETEPLSEKEYGVSGIEESSLEILHEDAFVVIPESPVVSVAGTVTSTAGSVTSAEGLGVSGIEESSLEILHEDAFVVIPESPVVSVAGTVTSTAGSVTSAEGLSVFEKNTS